MKEEYKQGDFLVYDTYGICEIKSVKKMNFAKGTPMKNYYVLAPLNSPNSTFYLPVDNDELCHKLRNPLSESEIKKLLDESKDVLISWIDNRQNRNECFHQIIDSGITPELLALIRCLYSRRQELLSQGKKLSSTDEGLFSGAEKLVREEFAFSLGIDGDEVTNYIQSYYEA